MSKITVSDYQTVLIEFDSDEWKSNEEYIDVANEIIDYLRNCKVKTVLIQNRSYFFGDTETNQIIKVHISDYGGIKGDLDSYIKDIIYDLIPEEEG